MIAGSVFSVLYGRKRRIKLDPFRKSETETMVEIASESPSHEHIETMNIRENNSVRLQFRKMPWLMWVCGTIMMAIVIFIEWVVHRS